MKIYKLILISLLVDLGFYTSSKAIEPGIFQIPTYYLSEGAVYVGNTSTTTPFAFSMGLSKGDFENGDCTITPVLIYGSTVTNLSGSISVATGDYSSPPTNFIVKFGNATLPANPIGLIKVKLEYFDVNTQQNVVKYSSKSYSIATSAWWTATPPYANTVALQRLYSPNYDVHLYVLNSEAHSLVSSNAYIREGLLGHINPTQVADTYPIYRKYRSSNRNTLYELNSSSLPAGYVNHGIIGYAYGTPGTNRIAILRWHRQGKHFYTNDGNEQPSGWTYEGIAFYILQ